ncbi:hypothetical protein ES705_49589 [subsurface metagenome]
MGGSVGKGGDISDNFKSLDDGVIVFPKALVKYLELYRGKVNRAELRSQLVDEGGNWYRAFAGGHGIKDFPGYCPSLGGIADDQLVFGC